MSDNTDNKEDFVYQRGEEQNVLNTEGLEVEMWINTDRLKEENRDPVTTKECIDYIRKLIDHEVFVYRNNSSVLSQDEIIRLVERRDKIIEALEKNDRSW